MSEHNRPQDHYRVASLVPDAEPIASETGKLGSYVMGAIGEGAFVPLSEQHAMEADFDQLPIPNEQELSEDYSSFKSSLAEQEAFSKTREMLGSLPESRKELFTAALFAADVARGFFSKNRVSREVRDKQGWLPIDDTRDDTYQLKKLSMTSDEGYCVEQSLLVGEVMKRLGQEASFTAGYYRYWDDEAGEYHAFLTAEGGDVLIDPLAMADSKNPARPLGLYVAGGQTIFDDPSQQHAYQNVLYPSMIATYSAFPLLIREAAA